MLSSRGARNAGMFNIPWRYAPTQTYDKDTNPHGLISFAMAEHIPMRKEIVKYINEKVNFTEDSISYRPKPSAAARLPRALANHLNKHFKPHVPIDPSRILVVSSPTALGGMLGFSLAESGDGILVSRPMYGRFELDYGVEADVKIVYADTDPVEAFTPAAIEKYEAALKDAEEKGTKIRAVLVANPNNPVGRCYPPETLKELLKFCQKHQIHFISDEVYALSVFDSGDPDAVPFTSVLSLDLSGLIDPSLVHVMYGFSKDFASGGLHLGFLITQNDQLLQACKAVLRLHGASGAAVTIGATILEDEEFVSSLIAKARQSLAASYKLATSTLDREGIRYVKGGNAGFFIYIDLSPYLPSEPGLSAQQREFALAQKLLDAGAFLHPGEEHAKEPGWFRLVFSQEEEVLVEGLRRILSVLKGR
ncbi:1-aminocyclopropane-1-carboxylate synthase [Thermoascus aurantiacus ATCC 26904]